MPPGEIELILRAIDQLRRDFAATLTDHETRLRDLEHEQAETAAVRDYKASMRRAMLDDRRWRIGLAITLGLAALGGIASLVERLGLL